ncbi:hypothetical protein GCM10011320_56140 [Neoroseomonas lacus]|uniref:Uncharacterized protein n=1 Tax=Neoroseomonas lacus TaxID=287609 RepID=A0A917L3M2_9PROT|nr:hypothetical protein GCM10011320_56140 [Neoroseomonas lacus]
MTSLPELLMQMGPAWHAVLAIAGGCLWLLAFRRVLRDLRRVSPARPEQARCGLPSGPLGGSPLAHYLGRNSHHRRASFGPHAA